MMLLGILLALITIDVGKCVQECKGIIELCDNDKCIDYVKGQDGCPTCECTDKADTLGDIRLEKNTRMAVEYAIGTRNWEGAPGSGPIVSKWDNIYEDRKWIIPYKFDDSLDRDLIPTILNAFTHFEERACLKFIPREDEEYYIEFSDDESGGCWSFAGRRMSRNPNVINLSSGCNVFGTVLQQIMHTLGFFHEHQRPDRDDYIEVLWENVWPGAEGNLYKFSTWSLHIKEIEYDVKSIMHDKDNIFSKDGISKTMLSITNKPLRSKHRELSKLDVKKLITLYRCESMPSDETTTQAEDTTTQATTPDATETADTTTKSITSEAAVTTRVANISTTPKATMTTRGANITTTPKATMTTRVANITTTPTATMTTQVDDTTTPTTTAEVTISTTSTEATTTNTTTEDCYNTNSNCSKRRLYGLCRDKPYESKSLCDRTCKMCGCDDKFPTCRIAAALGYCSHIKRSSVETMQNNCPLSCKLCGKSCMDTHANCSQRAEVGECYTKYQHMLIACPDSCGFCVASSIKKENPSKRKMKGQNVGPTNEEEFLRILRADQ